MANRSSLMLADDKLNELIENFNTLDADGSGYISVGELQTALETVGHKLPGFEVRQLVQQYDTHVKDGKIDIEEFKMMCAQLEEVRNVGRQFRKQVKTRQDVRHVGGTSEASSEGTTHSVKDNELHSFSDWINKCLHGDPDCAKYLPLDPDSNALYQKTGDGIVFCKMINLSVKDTIDERAINKTKLDVYRKTENLILVLNSAQSIGCNIVNIGPGDLMNGKPHLVLGLLWQIIRIGLLSDINLTNFPGLIHLLEEGETIDDLLKLTPEQILLRWVNYHLRNSGCGRQIANFQGDISDSVAYLHLLSQIAPPEAGVNPFAENTPDRKERAELMLQEADKINCRVFVGPTDVVQGNYKLNLAFVAHLFNTYPALEKPDEEIEVTEETREERTYRNWMNSMGVRPFVHRLYNDLTDGHVIFQLYDIIKAGSVDWNRVVKNFKKIKINFEKLENCNYAVELGRQLKFSLVGIGGQDILDGNQTLTLALVWQLMRAYTLAMLNNLSASDQPIVEDAIVEWANTTLRAAGKTSVLSSFQDQRLADGRIVIDLIDAIQPGSIQYNLVRDGVDEEEKLANAKYAVSMARKIGAKVYALPEDIVEVKQKMVMTLFACLMTKAFQKSASQNA